MALPETALSAKTHQILERGKLARTDLTEFYRFVAGYEPAPHQRAWIAALQEIADNPAGKKLCIIAPPGSGKTTLMVSFMAYMIGRYPTDHLGLLSYSDQVGWSRSRAVKEIIAHSKPYHITFPEIKPSKAKWGDTEFIIQRPDVGDPHPSLRAGGTSSAVVAYRLNGLLIDDPHDQKNSATPHQRGKTFKNYEDAIRTRMTAKGWQIVIGTRWSDDDFIGQLTKQKGWKTLHTAAISANGKSYWPSAYPFTFLDTIRYESPALFAVQYMGDTTGGETGIIRHVEYYNEDPQVLFQNSDLLVASSWDTAFKERQQNDFSVSYVGGMDKWGRIFLLDRIKGRWGLPGLLEQMSESFNKYNQSYIWIEDAASGTPAIQTLMESSPHIPTVPVSYSGGKTTRAHALAPFLHGGHVLFPKRAEWTEDAIYNLTRYPYVPHDDDLDALFILVNELSGLKHPAYINSRPEFRLVMR